jgi:hypothetical protein
MKAFQLTQLLTPVKSWTIPLKLWDSTLFLIVHNALRAGMIVQKRPLQYRWRVMEFFDEPPGYLAFNDANSNVN